VSTYLVTIGLLFMLLLGWVAVQRGYRSFARRHPQLGPFRDERGGCGGCGGGACSREGAQHCGRHAPLR
jgi:hypothetical protein